MRQYSTYLSPDRVFDVPLDVVLERICVVNQNIQKFWSECDGWAPEKAAELLGSVRLDWLTELSRCLYLWATDDPSKKTDGCLILAWTNLGSLVEGTLKLLLSVYFEDYISDLKAAKDSGTLTKRGTPKSPDVLSFQRLKIFCMKNEIIEGDNVKLVDLVQERRNAIHAYKDTDIGTWEEFENAVRGYYVLLDNIDTRLPYP